MRRWLVILMLVFLPAQFTWAAVVDHLEHVLAAADHAGHHDHASHGHGSDIEHGGAQSDSDGASGQASSHLDCDHCHGHCVGVIDAGSCLNAQAPGGKSPALGDAPCAEHVPAQPERPQWASLA
jgi:hypothetical protein